VALTGALEALLRHEPVSWRSLEATAVEFLEACADHEVTCLVHQRLSKRDFSDWPDEVRSGLSATARAESAVELIRGLEIGSVLAALGEDGIHPVLLKGTALGYTVYENPICRPREDTDLLICREDVRGVERVMAALGYERARQCEGELLFCQFELSRTDDFGITHAFDFHWRISTQPVFAGVLTSEELARDAQTIEALGEYARGPAPVHSLLLACVHPAMHHRNSERLIWMHDVHLLLSTLRAADLERFTAMAVERKVAAICRQQLALVQERFGSHVPDCVMARLSAREAVEPSADYLLPARRWHDELTSSLRSLPDWKHRGRLLSEVLFPTRDYMLSSYGLAPCAPSLAVLPLLYVHRAVRGAWNVMRRCK
jgi:hypothetical protein